VPSAAIRVLFVNHTSSISGGERSLFDLTAGLAAINAVTVDVACPEGPLAEALRARGVRVHRIPEVDLTLKLHPANTAAALLELARAARAVRQIALRVGADVVHANSVRAGMIAVWARRRGGAPVVVHVRDRLPAGRVSRLSLAVIGRADRIVANSAYTATSIPEWAADRLRVVANPVDLVRFDPERLPRVEARARLGVADDLPLLSLVAQITPWKGQEEAVRMLAHMRDRGTDARLLIVGDIKFSTKATRYDNPAYRAGLEALVDELDLRGRVTFTGEIEDIPAVMRASDVVLVPSWEEPFGRTVIESLAMGTPVVATEVGGPAEILREGVEGLLLPPRTPERWAEAVAALLGDPQRRADMSAAAIRRARDFSLDAHTSAVTAVYSSLIPVPVAAEVPADALEVA
jgi:glycosyltransferase involved in cell wall biosynthesis